jgi:dTDP-L-rhamnose 4-epimerase
MSDAILITGGAGFIGCALSNALESGELPVVAVDCLHRQVHPTGTRPPQLSPSAQLIEDHVEDPDTWSRLFTQIQPEIIVHLAAETGTGQSLTEASRHASVNVLGTTRMLDALSKYALRPRHIILCSSRAVYGEGAWLTPDGKTIYPAIRTADLLKSQRWTPETGTGEPLTPLPHNAAVIEPRPTSIYGATKLAQEHILKAWTAAYEVPLSILRLQNVYGPGQSPFNSYTGIITLFHRLAANRKRIEVYEDGHIGRDFVYIDDVVKTLVACIDNSPTNQTRLLDVGTGVPVTVFEAASLIATLYNAPTPYISGKYRNGDVRWAFCDPMPLSHDLGIVASVHFAEGCERVKTWLSGQACQD